MSNDIFDRVSQLIDQFQKQAGAGQTKQAFKLGDMSEYDVGKRVKPKDFLLQKEMEDVLSDTMPNNPTVSSVEEGAEQDDVDNAYPNSPGVAVSTEDGPEVDEVRQPLGGEEAMKDASVSRLSDGELLDKLASATYQLLYNYAMIEPTKTLIKSGAFSKDDVAAFTVADIVKQADYDADLVFGFLAGLTKAAEEAVNLEGATDPGATNPGAPVASAPVAGAEGESPEEVLASASPEEIAEVLQEDPELAAAVAGSVAEESPEQVLASASPEEIAEVLQEEPELAAAVAGSVAEENPAQVLATASPQEVLEVLQEDPELAQAAVQAVFGGPEKVASYMRKFAEEGLEDTPEAVLASASPEEIAEVLQEDPELAAAVAGGVAEEDPLSVLADAAPEEIAEVLQEDPALAAQLSEAVGGVASEAPEVPEEEGSEKEEEEMEEGSEEEEKEASTISKVAALSRVLDEQHITPDELPFYVPKHRTKDAVKVANAVRNFRNKYRGRNVKEADSPRLKEHMRQFLQELLTG